MQDVSSSSSDGRLHVLQVGPLYVNHVRRWSERAAALGWRVSVAGHVREGRGLIDFGDAPERIEVIPPRVWEGGRAGTVRWLAAIEAELEPDLVQAHWLPTWGLYGCEAGRRPVVVTPWGSDVYLADGERREAGDRALAQADAVIARSPHMRRELLRRGAAPERLRDVDLGVDLDLFRPAGAGERGRLREQLGLEDGPVVLSFRAGTELYNLDVVVDAFRQVRSSHPEATLVLLTGGAPLSEGLRASLAGLGAGDRVVVVAEPHERVASHMRGATVGVSIPGSDGSPSSVWEALGCGLPLVLSDLPQVRERVDEAAARFVDPRSGPVATALAEILDDATGRDRMARAAREWAERSAGIPQQLPRLDSLYQELVGEAAVRSPAGRSEPSPAAAPPSSPS